MVDKTGAAGDERDVGVGLLAGLALGTVFSEVKLILVDGFTSRVVVTGGLSLP